MIYVHIYNIYSYIYEYVDICICLDKCIQNAVGSLREPSFEFVLGTFGLFLVLKRR